MCKKIQNKKMEKEKKNKKTKKEIQKYFKNKTNICYNLFHSKTFYKNQNNK